MITSGVYWLIVLIGVPLHWLLPARVRPAFVALVSIGLLVSLDAAGCAAFLAWSLAFYFVAPLTRADDRRWLLPLAIVGILAYLAFYKYAPPLVSGLFGESSWSGVAIPLGLSYFTFKLIHYVVEVSRRKIRDRSLWRFLCWVFLFPIFTAGPIERFDHFLEQAEERLSRDAVVEGLMRIVVGLVKKLVIVELVLDLVLIKLEHPRALDTSGLVAWKLCIASFLTTYLDFSAYSDIAIGTSRLFGFRILENFNWPILAPNIGEFWNRWHMTLVGWCRSYVYLPTIGLTRNPYVAVYALCLAVGVWHAGTWSYVIWGLYHATGVVIFQTWKRFKTRRKLKLPTSGPWSAVGIVGTLLFVSSSFAFTGREPAEGLRMLARLLFIDVG